MFKGVFILSNPPMAKRFYHFYHFYHFYCLMVVSFVGVLWGFQNAGVVPHYLNSQHIVELNHFLAIHNAKQYVGELSWTGYIFTAIGVIFGGYASDRWGRKKTLIVSGCVGAVSFVPINFYLNVYVFMSTLGIMNFVNGAVFVASVSYLAEAAPAESRGRWVVLSQLMAAISILFAYFVFYPFNHFHHHPMQYRFMLLLSYYVLITVFCFFIPESPRWVAAKGQKQQAEKLFKRLNNEKTIARELSYLENIQPCLNSTWSQIRSIKYLPLTVLIISLITSFIFLSEINSVLRFSPAMILQGDRTFPLSEVQLSMIFGCIYTIGIFVSMLLVDWFGRRLLVFVSVIGMIASYVSISIMISFTLGDEANYWFELLRPFTIIFFFSLGSTAILALILCEYFPTHVRSKCIAIVLLFSILATFITRVSFYYLEQKFGFTGIYWVSTLCALIYLILYNELLPETKDKVIDDINVFQ